jgi:geranylgeranyl diphosphate synthase, type I
MTSRDRALGHIRGRVDRALQAFLRGQQPVLLAADGELAAVTEAISGLLAGGKRLRAAFCYWGWRGAGGPDCPEIFAAAAALELLHAGALVHDDLMDASDTRRGRPSLHRQFEERHARQGWRGSPAAFGMGAAILTGDLLLSWADEMFQASGLPGDSLRRGRGVLDVMRSEVFAGQYLDLLAQAAGGDTVESALRVVEFKTAKYTIERPLQLGAALAGADVDPGIPTRGESPAPAGAPGVPPPAQRGIAAAYAAYGLPLGVAFQLRDDILGVFGDPAQTGKPAGDDLREGKRTVLLAITRARAAPWQAQVIETHLGDPLLSERGTAQVREVITATGALAECEAMIERHVAQALAALDGAPVTGEAKHALAELAEAATARQG